MHGVLFFKMNKIMNKEMPLSAVKYFFINLIDPINCVAKLTDVKPMKI